MTHATYNHRMTTLHLLFLLNLILTHTRTHMRALFQPFTCFEGGYFDYHNFSCFSYFCVLNSFSKLKAKSIAKAKMWDHCICYACWFSILALRLASWDCIALFCVPENEFVSVGCNSIILVCNNVCLLNNVFQVFKQEILISTLAFNAFQLGSTQLSSSHRWSSHFQFNY